MANLIDNKASLAASSVSVPSGDASRLISARRHGQAIRAEGKRTRPEDFGGHRLQLSVSGTIPGYHLYWENDENGAIEGLLQEGFDFVSQDELNQQQPLIVPDLDISSVISKYVKGQKVDGSPLRAYLMKCTDEMWADREKARYRQADEWENQIRAGAMSPSNGQYKPRNSAASIDTTFKKEY